MSLHQTFDALLEKIRHKRKQTPFLDYLREIASWQPINFYEHPESISRYPVSDRIQILPTTQWQQKRDELTKHGRSIDESFSPLQQFEQLFRSIPQSSLYPSFGSENAEYSDQAGMCRNIYLSRVVANSENIAHSMFIKSVTNVFDSMAVWDESENVYSSVGVIQSFNIFYSRFIQDSRDIWFSSNLIGCQNCLFCSDLTSVSYCIHNQQYSAEEYSIKMVEILSQKEKFEQWYTQTRSRGMIINSPESTGNFVIGSENVQNGLCAYNVHQGRNVLFTWGKSSKENFFDSFASGSLRDVYGSLHAVFFSEHIYCTAYAHKSYMILYSHYLSECSYCFGCVGLQNKQFHIFNQPYSEIDWFIAVERLLQRMEKEGTLGDFFLPTTNPFYFNETIAGLMYGFSREEILEKWYLWRDEFPTPTARSWDDILISKTSWEAYRFTALEKDFVQKHSLPLPQRHWRERMRENLMFQ